MGNKENTIKNNNEQYKDDKEIIQGQEQNLNSQIKNKNKKSIPLNLTNKIMKSLCKINIQIYFDECYQGNGFFLKFKNSKKYMITNNSLISEERINEQIEIEIWNKNNMELDIKDRNIKYFPKPKDITLIEIKETDEIFKDIEFLEYDSNYRKGYDIYNNIDIFSIIFPLEDNMEYISGKIIKINNYEFYYDITTDEDSIGCPIILLDNTINIIKVIGIQKNDYNLNKLSCGTFIGEIFNEEEDNDINENYIIAVFNIKKYSINKEIRIINSYEEYERVLKGNYFFENKMNEEEIKTCEISINEKVIPFSYKYMFNKTGKYYIKYSFANLLTKMNCMFENCWAMEYVNFSHFNTKNVTNMNNMVSGCTNLKNLNLTNFNTQNVTDMSFMFSCCSSLKHLDLSHFNAQSLTDMDHMFFACHSLKNIILPIFNNKNTISIKGIFENCSSLKYIDLSKFNNQKVGDSLERMFRECTSLKSIDLTHLNTQNVITMKDLFYKCESLTNINLSNLNTQNVTDMSSMFNSCKSLKSIDLSSFNTQNVIDMRLMFFSCKSLKSLDLSNFSTQNVTNIAAIFNDCSSLRHLDLSNFNIHNITKREQMFKLCKSLRRENIITKDDIIIQTFENDNKIK